MQTWSLPATADVATIAMSVMPMRGEDDAGGGSTGLWAVTASVGSIPQGVAFFPNGFGETLAHGYGMASGRYPGSGCTMQFAAAWGGNAAADGHGGMYFAAHDAGAHMKYLYAHEHSHSRHTAVSALERGDEEPSTPLSDGTGFSCSTPLAPHGFPFVSDGTLPMGTQSLTVTTLVEGAGALLNSSGYVLPFVLAVAPLPVKASAAPLWYAAAQLYRAWALSSAEWTQKGPIAARPHDFPQWFLDLNVWVNSGWQCLDRFNDTQGDPPTVLRNMMAIKRRFNLTGGQSIGLHWYEWQCGFADNCTTDHGAHRFKFDTEYPDYFPPRRGAGFRDVVDALLAEGVRTFPYINGRIFDNNSKSFTTEGGLDKVVKQARAPVLDAARPGGGVAGPLAECKEFYGSHELDGRDVYFDVADPTTPYWQDKYADTVGRLVNGSHVAGVYIDQLCAGSPVADWTPRAQHGAGGGAWWRRGLVDLVSKAHARATVPGGVGGAAGGGDVWAPLVTESNAEFLMDQVNGLLTLVAFGVPFAPPATPSPGHRVLAPAFAAVYGGYYVAFGSIYTHNDLALNPDVFASRLATSFVYGAQMGWFSLGGVDHGPDMDHKCGPMHTLDSFLSPERDPEVAFLRRLASARASVQRYFVHGRLAPPVALTPAPATFVAPPQAIAPRNPGPFPTLSTSVWFAAGDATLCIFLVASTGEAVQAAFELDMAATYRLAGGLARRGSNFDVFLLGGSSGDDTLIKRVRGSSVVALNRTVPGRSYEMLELREV